MPAAVADPEVTQLLADSLFSTTVPGDPTIEMPWLPDEVTLTPERRTPEDDDTLMPTEAARSTVDPVMATPVLVASTRTPLTPLSVLVIASTVTALLLLTRTPA